ncbi:YihY/virulence factor BrkB family protein [Fictibacillus nanhaiensis]|uniref:YihY/virulence factor BrkB family protein n=1 Tax=Fictibacillus nanhaiensis TaxID=742169 RepID=UPI001C98126C|nr:YihY/virulence factor BrkB family protein [Fictibacillus nanhaiensis]MBY6037879.1 YihY/virulence factor BrkB family protein [Fictibacillus nanhaiensis]
MRWLMKQWFHRFFEDKVFDLSAQLAYYFLVSLFPFVFLIFTVLGFLPISTAYVLTLFQSIAPEEAYTLLEYNLIAVLDEHRGDVLSLSFIIMIWLATIGTHAIIRVFNQAYKVQESRPFVKELILGVFLTIGLVIAVITALLLPVFGRTIGIYLFEQTGYSHPVWHIWETARYVIGFSVLIAIFSALYMFAPNVKLSFSAVWPGAIFSTIGWHVFSYLFSSYVLIFDYGQIYGNLGALLTLMIWFYLSAMILIAGGQLNAILAKRKQLGK